MIQIPKITVTDFADTTKVVKILQRCFDVVIQELVKLGRSEYVDVQFVTGGVLADSFPRAVTIDTEAPRSCYVARVRDNSNPTSVITDPITMLWDMSEDGNIRILNITNLNLNTNYTITIEVRQ